MAWIQLKEDDVKDRLAANELSLWDSAGQSEGEINTRINGIITQVTGLVRGRVATCRESTLGAACLIPEELLWSAATIAKNMILNSIPATATTSQDERSDENRRAHDMLDQAAKCELQITGEDSVTTANQTESEFGGDPLLTF